MSRYAKAITAIVGAIATWATTFYPDDLDVQKWVGLATALATVVAVYAIPNTPPAGEPADPRISERGASDLAIVIGALVIAVALVLAFGVNNR